MLEKLRAAGALAGRLDDRLIFRLNLVSTDQAVDLQDLFLTARLEYQDNKWRGFEKPFGFQATYGDWLFVRCHILQPKCSVNNEVSEIPIPFESEL